MTLYTFWDFLLTDRQTKRQTDLWYSYSWLRGMTWDPPDKHLTLQTEPQCWQHSIDDDLNIYPPKHRWRQCCNRCSRSPRVRTCQVACDRIWRSGPQWSRHCHNECLPAPLCRTPPLEQSKQQTVCCSGHLPTSMLIFVWSDVDFERSQ